MPEVGGEVARLVNLSHLRYLDTSAVIEGGRRVGLVHIYSEAPDYHFVDAKESGPEGIACVDDGARAAVVYLAYAEATGDTAALARARRQLEFVRAMQLPDGRFYNFVRADGSINRTGPTSHADLGWWAARGLWALGRGVEVFRQRDPAYAETLAVAANRTVQLVARLAAEPERDTTMAGRRWPLGLVQRINPCSTSELLLGLTALARDRRAHPSGVSDSLDHTLGVLAQRLARTRLDAPGSPYDGTLLTDPDGWHGWAAAQVEALAEAGAVLHDPSLIVAARSQADGLYERLEQTGPIRGFQFIGDSIRVDRFDQIAYAVRPTVVGLVRLAQATGDTAYSARAGRLARWFRGENAVGVAMYDPATGRGYDGINPPKTPDGAPWINFNSGAESTTEALISLIAVAADPVARRAYEAP